MIDDPRSFVIDASVADQLATNRAKSLALPEGLDLADIHDKAVGVAQSLSGLRVSDAISILENAKHYLCAASIALTALIPPRSGEPQTAQSEHGFAPELVGTYQDSEGGSERHRSPPPPLNDGRQRCQ
jgi:hypothetical protein